MNRKKIDTAKQYGESIACRIFKDFSDHPEYKGENFTWVGYANTIEEMAQRQVDLNMLWKGRQEKLLKECMQVAGEAAKKKWLELTKEHGHV